MKKLAQLKIKLFADGADQKEMLQHYQSSFVQGFTTNPTLMRKAGVTDYQQFALDILKIIKDKPVSFEVFSDDFREMYHQALEISSWGKNVYVKIPITNTKGQSACELIQKLAKKNIKQNITALMTIEQVRQASVALRNGPSSFLSVFAGRIADTGRDPVPLMREMLAMIEPQPEQSLIWASPREVLNIFQADEIGCHVITITHDILKKLSILEKDLDVFSLETVKMFYDDALKAGFSLTTNQANLNHLTTV